LVTSSFAPSVDLVVVVDIDGDGNGDLADHALTSEHLGQHRDDSFQQ